MQNRRFSEAAHSLYDVGVDLEEGGEASQVEDIGDAGRHIGQAQVTSIPALTRPKNRDENLYSRAGEIFQILEVHTNAISARIHD